MSDIIPADPDGAARWWREPPALRRVATDLLAGEMALMRPGARPPPPPWPAGFDLRADLGADSLDMMGLATAVETMFHLHRAAPSPDDPAGAPLLARAGLDDWLRAIAAGLERDASLVTFRTSGSSGTPKPCTHALSLLWQETGVLAGLFPGRRRVVALVPAHHIYGFLFTVLLPRRLGLAAADTIDLRGHGPAALARLLRPGDLVVGHPDAWRAFAAGAPGPGQGGLPPDVMGATSTAPCPPEVARAVLAAGVARLVQVYGSSETAGVGWRDDPDGDYALFPYWSRVAQEDRLARPGRDGRLLPYPLQDRLAWSAPGRFRPSGRIDAAVQVGGVNVFAAYVADVLRLHPAVGDASVRLMRADEGRRLKAFVVPRGGVPADTGALRAALQAWMGERLSAPECPAAYSFGAALPRQASGKAADWIIDAWP